MNVVDEYGNEYASTYIKRATGLVKKGRARWVDDGVICLAHPPNMDLEDHKMEDVRLTVSDDATTDARAEYNADTEEPETMPTLSGILKRIDAIIAQGDELGKVVDRIVDIPVNDSINGGYDGQSRADAIGNIYVAREKTNQQTLELLNRMYDDVTGVGKGSPKSKDERLAEVLKSVSFAGVESDGVLHIMNRISDILRK